MNKQLGRPQNNDQNRTRKVVCLVKRQTVSGSFRLSVDSRSWFMNCAIFITLIFIILLNVSCTDTRPRWLREKQELMAQELGVNIDDYGPAYNFPWRYLGGQLVSGMSTWEVHQIIPRHEAVFLCDIDSIPNEIYYFFSDEDEKAVRIRIVYDEHRRYQFLDPEDRESHNISVQNCEPGYLTE